jgi:hypothetical protein
VDLDVTTIFQLYIGLTGLLYYVCTTVVTVVGTTFLIETAAHLTALAHLCFTGSALVITLFIIVGATFFFLLRQLVSLQRQLIHVSMGQFVCILFSLPVFEITFLIGTGCPFYVVGSFFFVLDQLTLVGYLYTSSPCDLWVG